MPRRGIRFEVAFLPAEETAGFADCASGDLTRVVEHNQKSNFGLFRLWISTLW
jgi:hypothetical protein